MTPTDGGIGGFDSATLESILIFFMFISGLNFAALYLIAVKGQFNEIKDEEMRNYAIHLGPQSPWYPRSSPMRVSL